jgi:SAM-dependent methyltransferase
MNKAHLEYCSSDEWAEGIKKWIIPNALANVELGDSVLEVGPGPGRTTEVLKDMAPRLTAAEIDADLASKLAARLRDVSVVHADGTALPFADNRFSAALSFTMMHHVPSVAQQNELFAEVARVLRPGGVLAGVDSHDTPEWREMHIDDICVPLEPDELEERLRRAGFADVSVDDNPYVVQWRAIVS